MALNCPDVADGNPCGRCESCETIWAGATSLDVLEIDAASNRGVDDARELRERAQYAPTSSGRYKVYILDEAHMLTREAWNALLKVIEEPPPRVVFAFATTEPQKIEQTAAPVMSRCQRFDFRRVSVTDIVGRLKTVLEKEGVSASLRALTAIARRAEGGVRDALSLLDQVLSFRGDSLDDDDVREMLGMVEDERYLDFFDIWIQNDRAAVFPFVQQLLDDGHDPAEFLKGLSEALRTLLILNLDPGTPLIDLPGDIRDRYLEVGQDAEAADVLRRLVLVSEFLASNAMVHSGEHRIQLEVLLLRIVCMSSTVTLEDLFSALGSGSVRPVRTKRQSTPGSIKRQSRSTPHAPRTGSKQERRTARKLKSGSEVSVSKNGRKPLADESPKTPKTPSEAWTEAVRVASPSTGMGVPLKGTQVVGLEGNRLILGPPEGFWSDLRELLGDRRRVEPLRNELQRLLQTEKLEFKIVEISRQGGNSVKDVAERKLQDRVERDPQLRRAVEVLDLVPTRQPR